MALKIFAGLPSARTILSFLLIPLALVVIVKNPEASAAFVEALIRVVAGFLGGVAESIGDLLAGLADASGG